MTSPVHHDLHYDLIVIGTGSGNTIVDDSFAGLRVAIVEKHLFGGTCLNVGCIPTKMFVYPGDLSRHAAEEGPRLGVHSRSDGVDWPAVRDRVFGRIDPIAAGGERYREGQEHVDVHHGTARFVGDRALVVEHTDGSTTQISGDQVVLAAGSRVELPLIEGLDLVAAETGAVHTSDTVMRLDRLPERTVIVGGGFVGAEFAHVFSSYGSQVTQVHRGSRLLRNEDDAVSERFTEIAQRQWDVRLGVSVASLEPLGGTSGGSSGASSGGGDGVRVRLDDGSALETDCLLLATGRVPNSDLLDLDRGGVQVDPDGFVVVDPHLRTTADGVWALGDLCSPEMLKHVANQGARVVQHNLLHPDDLRVSDHRFVPSAVFTSPQIASVGQTERQARADGLDVVTATTPYADVAYGWAMEDTDHFCKLVADRRSAVLVGAHLIGPQASILIQPLIQALSFGLPLRGLARGQYWIHPALAEVVENALLAIEGRVGRRFSSQAGV